MPQISDHAHPLWKSKRERLLKHFSKYKRLTYDFRKAVQKMFQVVFM